MVKNYQLADSYIFRFLGSGIQVFKIFRKLTSLVSTSTLLLGLLAAVPLGVLTSTTANAVTCNATAGTLAPLHRPSSDAWNSYRPFYADDANTSTTRSGYAGYAISGSLVNSVTDLWIGLSSFTSPTKLTLSSNQTATIPARDFFKDSNGNDVTTKRVAYFYLYAPDKVATAQTFTITLYNGNPAIGGTTICTDVDGFSSVNDVISANANKITSVSVSNPTPAIGSDFTVTATGQTGTLGKGPTDDRLLVAGNNIGPISLSPSMADSWKADAFTLVGIQFKYDVDNNGSLSNDTFQYNWLRYYPTSTSSKLYEVVYLFTVRAVAANIPVRPVQNIVSGTQVKYTGSYSGSALTASITSTKDKVSINKTIKSVTAVGNPTGNPQYDLIYQLKLKNNANVESTIDYIKDTVNINTGGATGGAFVAPTNGGTLTLEGTGSITNLLVKATSTSNQMVLNFNGPIVLASLSTNTIEYKVRISYPASNASMPIGNQAVGYIGAETISATAGVDAVTIDLKATVALTIAISADGYVSVDALQTDGTVCSSSGATGATTCTFYSGTALTLTATANLGTYTVSSWLTAGSTSLGTCTASSAVNPCSFVINANKTITPTFSTSYVVRVLSASNIEVSDGTATLFSCTGGTCSKTYGSGSIPTITFTPAPGYVVNSISTNASSPSSATINSSATPKNVVLTVNSNIDVTLTVGQTSYVLDVSVLTAGGNKVTSSPSGIVDCGTGLTTEVCSAAFNAGTSVSLTATGKTGGGVTYTFSSWGGDCSGTGACSVTMSSNKSVTATFTSTATFTVTFNNNSVEFGASGIASPSSATQSSSGASINLASVGTMTLSGYTFSGWAIDPYGSPLTGSTFTPTADTTLYAVWTPTTYSVTYDGNGNTGGSVPVDGSSPYTNNTTVTVLTDSGSLTKTGYTFDGWYSNSSGTGGTAYAADGTATFTMGTANRIIYAKWLINSYSITFDRNYTGKPSDTVVSVNYGVDALLSKPTNPTRTGYTFDGWSSSGSTPALTTYAVSGAATLKAIWIPISYNITFDRNFDGKSADTVVSVAYDADALASKPADPTRTGYTFAGWNTSGSGSALSSYTVTGSATLKAIWTLNTYTIAYNYNYGSPASTETKTLGYGSNALSVANAPSISRTGYSLSGWSETSNGSVISTYSVTGTKEFFAIWEVASYSITFDRNYTGKPSDTIVSVTHGENALLSKPTDPTRTGYIFDGWSTSGSTPALTTYVVTSSGTLKAIWTVNNYTLTYNGNGNSAGSVPNSVTQAFGTTVLIETGTALAKVDNGITYTFHGWTENNDGTGATYDPGDTYTFQGDKTLYAHWIAPGSKTVTFNPNYGTGASSSQTRVPGTYGLATNTFARTDYVFKNWNTLASPSSGSPGTAYTNGQNYDFSADLTLYAQWNAITTITFDSKGGSTTPTSQTCTQNVDCSTAITQPTDPSKSGYTFSGWTDSCPAGPLVTWPYNPGASSTPNTVTLCAVWSAVSYTVTFNSNGGAGTMFSQTASSQTALTNNSFTRDGYTFAGWSATSGDGQTVVYTNGANYPFTSSTTLYAQWTANPTSYTITYAATNADSGSAPANTTGSGSVTLRTNSGNLSRSGYTFAGWNTGTGCSGTNYSAGGAYTLNATITLYPCWNSNPVPSSPTPEPTPNNNGNSGGGKIKPVVVWKNPNAIKTTTTLSTTQLNAVATVSTMVTPTIINPTTSDKLPTNAPTIAGTYVYTPIVPTVVTAGVNQVTTITSASTAMTGTIKSVDPTTTPSTPTTPTSPGNSDEKPVLGQGTTLAPGLQKMKVVFIPTDSTTYEPVETEVEILVQAETKVDWVEPAPIKKNTPIGPAQLNALGSAPGLSNNVPGTYKYDLPEGTTLAPGKYPVKVIFTPTDPNYLPSETTTTITVIADINPLATPIITPSNTPAGKPITNTTPAANARVVIVGRGLTSATTDGTQVNIVPVANFSGKTTVKVSVTDEGETKEVDVPVTVLPLPAVTPVATPNTKGQSTINWKPSVNAIQYEVTLAGKSICTTSATSCSTNALIGPKSDIKVTAKGNDETVAPVTPAKYVAPKKPVTALVVYFDTNKFNLDAKDKADIRAIAKVIIEQGFKNIVVNGHTDIRGGVDNQVLSRNRSNSTFDYLKSLVPGLNVTIGAFASTKPAVKGTSAAALASNRRAEVGVY